MRRNLLAVVGVAALPLISACQGPECTLIGAESGVGFYRIDYAFPDYHTRYHVRACVGDECADWTGDRREAYALWVPLGGVSGPTTVSATLTLTSPIDRVEVVFEDSTSVDLTIHQPNGPGCEPTVYQGTVEVTRGGDLVSRPFASG